MRVRGRCQESNGLVGTEGRAGAAPPGNGAAGCRHLCRRSDRIGAFSRRGCCSRLGPCTFAFLGSQPQNSLRPRSCVSGDGPGYLSLDVIDRRLPVWNSPPPPPPPAPGSRRRGCEVVIGLAALSPCSLTGAFFVAVLAASVGPSLNPSTRVHRPQ